MFPYFAAKNRKAPAFLSAQRLLSMELRQVGNFSKVQDELEKQCRNLVGLEIIGLDTLIEIDHAYIHVTAQAR